MPTIVLVGVPTLVILGLTALVVYERHTKSSEARKRTDHLKRWLHSQEQLKRWMHSQEQHP